MDLNIVVLYNKENIYEDMKKSAVFVLDDISYEIIGIDNRENQYSSVASAYNYAIDNFCNAEVLVFCHQDVLFFEDSLKKIVRLCKENINTLYGAAGITEESNIIISSIHQNTVGYRYNTLSQDEIRPIFALDECFVAANKTIFERIRFDDKNCNGFHLYVHDLCYQCHLKSIEVMVVDLNIAHLSGGKLDSSFFDCLQKLTKKYKKDYKILRYTWGYAYTCPILSHSQRLYRKLKYKL